MQDGRGVIPLEFYFDRTRRVPHDVAYQFAETISAAS